jgi:hypothetical protein
MPSRRSFGPASARNAPNAGEILSSVEPIDSPL